MTLAVRCMVKCPLLCAQALQKRLLQKSEEVADRDMRLKEAAETKAELEAAAARLPGPEAAEQLVLYQVGSRTSPVSCCICTNVTLRHHELRKFRLAMFADLVGGPVAQASLREKTEQLQALSAEVSMHQAQAAEQKLQIRQLTDAINETKQQWFAQKRREQHRQHAEFAAAAETASQSGDSDMSKTLGGGYVVTAAA